MAVRVLVSGGGMAGARGCRCADAARDRRRPRRAGDELADRRRRGFRSIRTASGCYAISGSTGPSGRRRLPDRDPAAHERGGTPIGEFPYGNWPGVGGSIAIHRERGQQVLVEAASGVLSRPAGHDRARVSTSAGGQRKSRSTTVRWPSTSSSSWPKASGRRRALLSSVPCSRGPSVRCTGARPCPGCSWTCSRRSTTRIGMCR